MALMEEHTAESDAGRCTCDAFTIHRDDCPFAEVACLLDRDIETARSRHTARRGEAMSEHSVEFDALPEWLDDALCDALMAAQHGKYDGMTVETHLRLLLARVRSPSVTPSGEGKP